MKHDAEKRDAEKVDDRARLETLLYSTGGVIILAIILILANFVLGQVKQRVDLTDGRLYTLTEGTKTVLGKLQGPIRIRLYFSQGDSTVPLPVKSFGRRVEDLLAEYRAQGNGKIIVEKLDPKPDSEAEDAAELDGVEAQQLPSGDKFYLGISVSNAGQKLALPVLSLDREELLEYDLTRAIARSLSAEKPVIGVMSAIPLFGSRGVPQRGIPPSEKQVLISELERDFTVRQVRLDSEKIEDDIKVLLVIHPRDIQDKGLYAIDQFVMRGGKLIAMTDPFSYFDAQYAPQAANGAAGTSSTIDKLARAWGVTMDGSRVLADTKYISGQGPRAMPTVLTLLQDAFNADDVATKRLSNLLLPFPGVYTGKPAEGLTETVLVHSSKLSKLVDSTDATKAGESAISGFKPAETEFALAVKLTGKFKTAFPDGKPADKPKEDPNAAGAGPAAPAKPAAKPAAKAAKDEPKAAPGPEHKAESPDNAVILISDADFINDGAAVEIQDVFGQRVVVPSNGNLAFVQALVEQFAGDPSLISVRSRATVLRPFTVIRDMEAQAQQAYTGKIKELETQLQESTKKLQALQQQRPAGAPGATTILTPEQQAEVDKFRQLSAEARKELKEVRKDLRADSESLMFWTKVMNIGLVPLLIALTGLMLALHRRKRVVTI